MSLSHQEVGTKSLWFAAYEYGLPALALRCRECCQFKPWAVSAESRVALEPILSFKDDVIVVEDHHMQPVRAGDLITITRADEPALFVKTGWRFYEKVRSKL